ncbi:hypothetical protein EVB94_253 [Rhizobium phage RHph_TM40]|uniref:Uncharacterized protein n=1 Tax=Rhizobium phage RHph_TM30 TaxID=2509764 RepID=A0A7S5R5B9_9CAUD|nr:hypothetical protein PQC16_gp253 [Rhizobium phage RHph_TM30]QIG71724.1 hypothetical protein EVB94_253 [Rhizobium phage RHph_TM40]QIG72087.1 hypothetical protein EVB95_253 [Rhizobium phage RHph_TM2_3B]QIG72449.1 hypothetical protein EVB96_253 [Rhizobium phage RHph_TM3_3_6]QIG77839.1 hypothetical protein EVB64_252 [Rhizobium phage RHph_TM61]QIG71360.1 hypothetical protein EVB93_253 [Rhizobium phage RHph_TM30]
MNMKIKRIFKSLFFRRKHVIDKLVLIGRASDYVSDPFMVGSYAWKSLYGTYKLQVDSVDVAQDKVVFYSYYIDPHGSEFIQGNYRVTTITEIVRRVRSLRLLVDI